MHTQALILDRDHTLIHIVPERLAQIQGRLSAVAPGLGLPAVRAAWERWPGPWPRAADEEPLFWGVFAAGLLHDLGLDADVSALAAELTDIYHTSFVAYPDAAPALATLRAAGLRLAVLSNFGLPSFERPLAGAGLDPGQFESQLSSAALGYAKPDARAYLAAAAALGLPPERCCFVDDLAENVAGARLVGMRAFQIDRASPANPAGGVIGSLLDLIELLPRPAQPGASPCLPTPYDAMT